MSDTADAQTRAPGPDQHPARRPTDDGRRRGSSRDPSLAARRRPLARGGARAPEGGAGVHPRVVHRMSDVFGPHLRRHRGLALSGLFLATGLGAWSVRFVQDDAFISFRYARNLAQGRGLVFNTGDRVEGYTNFLWTLMMSVPERLGWSAPLASQLLGVLLVLATLAVTLRLARNVLGNATLAYFSGIALVTNMTFLSYATGGLETMLQTLLVTSIAALLIPVERAAASRPTSRRVGAGVLAGLALMTRLDSAVLIGTIFLVHVVVATRPRVGETEGETEGDSDDPHGGARSRVLQAATVLATLAVPALVVVAPWAAWKLAYYGHPLPNTFAAKTGGNPIGPILFGLVYLAAFFIGYFLFLLIGRWRRHRHELFALPGTRQLCWVVPVWLGYVVIAGADFMEFRFLVPILPVLAMVIAFLVDRYTVVWRQALLIGALLFASWGHIVLPSLGYPVHTFHDLNIWPSQSHTSLEALGTDLAEAFPGGLDAPGQVTMAVGNLGALPYYSQLPTVDMFGLADTTVARDGAPLAAYYPGHLRVATIEDLSGRGVHLVSLFRVDRPREPQRRSYRLSELVDIYPVVDLHDLPASATVIELPVDERTVWLVIYLTRSDKVDAAIAEHRWRELPIERVCRDEDVPALVEIFGSATCT